MTSLLISADGLEVAAAVNIIHNYVSLKSDKVPKQNPLLG
jgi:hypothetical protein